MTVNSMPVSVRLPFLVPTLICIFLAVATEKPVAEGRSLEFPPLA